MIKNFKCHALNLGDRVSLQMMSNHLNLKSSIGTQDFALTGTKRPLRSFIKAEAGSSSSIGIFCF
ncbi:MAG: hypothetical protein AJITA_00647 [Acetilactobacillus jinshanensis]